MILEGIVTTVSPSGVPNVAPMGPKLSFDPQGDFSSFLLRPFQTSTTYRNLKQNPQGVLHVTDDVLLIAKGAIGRLSTLPNLRPLNKNGTVVALVDACRYYHFEVTTLNDQSERTEIECKVIESQTIRPFFGFNRAKHAVIELAILATRIGILPDEEITAQLSTLQSMVDKTGGKNEIEAFEMLRQFVCERVAV